ncbi:hypothetical protein BRADI_4g12861v3 [Brachypodium distachyon]|uniref:MATH domain-containing protein n=2 Tax=Brachypodium distachyon TaxID=15368 RepID=A0A0Q3L4U0_BRADI|nr:hypothetical protein BRADI_4g12861v3 [Brachypodium distachyon]
MAALRAAGRKQLSASTLSGPNCPTKATGSHVFRISDYSQVRDNVGNGTAVQSSTFAVGGHDWQIRCYPNHPNGEDKENEDWISVYLRRHATAWGWANFIKPANATAKFEMSILDQDGKLVHRGGGSKDQRCVFSSSTGMGWGYRKFIKHADLQEGKHLKGDSLTLLCDVTVDLGLEFDGATVPVPETAAVAPPPPSFELRGDTAELRIDDMDANVCKALLQFIYTDSAPEMDQLDQAMAERLLAAADTYKLEKLKKICEEALCKNINMGSVAANLMLAERHGCPLLKEACLQLLCAPGNLEAVMATDDYEQLLAECASALLEVVVKKIAGQQQ